MSVSSEPINLHVVSALAEGSDRIGARLGLSEGFAWPHPCLIAAEDLSTRFAAENSKAEFRHLLSKAASVLAFEGDRREDAKAYERAGMAVLDPQRLVDRHMGWKAVRGTRRHHRDHLRSGAPGYAGGLDTSISRAARTDFLAGGHRQSPRGPLTSTKHSRKTFCPAPPLPWEGFLRRQIHIRAAGDAPLSASTCQALDVAGMSFFRFS